MSKRKDHSVDNLIIFKTNKLNEHQRFVFIFQPFATEDAHTDAVLHRTDALAVQDGWVQLVTQVGCLTSTTKL